MSKLSKPFRFAVEGATCDGRTISRQDIADMAATYKPATYTARVNMEHIRGFSADPPFHAYGDVAAGLFTQEVELEIGGKKEKRLGLYGQVEALDNLVALNAKGQKLYPSIEINPNFSNSGKAYLQGLAVTDSPASLGTEIMQFAAGAGDANPFKQRKLAAGNFFSAVDEGVKLEFEEEAAPSESARAFAAITSFFTGLGKKPDEPVAPPAPPAPPATPPAANDNFAAFATQMGAMATGLEKLNGTLEGVVARITAVEAKTTELSTSIATTDGGGAQRTTATGGGNYAVADF